MAGVYPPNMLFGFDFRIFIQSHDRSTASTPGYLVVSNLMGLSEAHDRDGEKAVEPQNSADGAVRHAPSTCLQIVQSSGSTS